MENQETRKEELYSQAIPAGKRRYFFDVKETRGGDKFITITESRKLFDNRTGEIYYEKNKMFLYKEDFDKFADGLQEVVNYIRERCPAEPDVQPAEPAEASEQTAPTPFSDVNFEEL